MAQSIKYVRTLTKSDLSPILILMGLIGYGLVIDPSNGSHGIYAPVDEHAKLGITPPFHPGIVLRGRFGLGGHDRLCGFHCNAFLVGSRLGGLKLAGIACQT